MHDLASNHRSTKESTCVQHDPTFAENSVIFETLVNVVHIAALDLATSLGTSHILNIHVMMPGLALSSARCAVDFVVARIIFMGWTPLLFTSAVKSIAASTYVMLKVSARLKLDRLLSKSSSQGDTKHFSIPATHKSIDGYLAWCQFHLGSWLT